MNKTIWILGGLGVAGFAGVAIATRNSNPEVPPKRKGLTRYDSEAFVYGPDDEFVIVIDRKDPDLPKRWRVRVYDKSAYGNGKNIKGKQRAQYLGQGTRKIAYLRMVRFIDDNILGGK